VTPQRRDDARARRKVVETILNKHDAATGGHRFNALFASSIAYCRRFNAVQAERKQTDPKLAPCEESIYQVRNQSGQAPAQLSDQGEQLPDDAAENSDDGTVSRSAPRARSSTTFLRS
jgi:type I restriction enzyme, R subunit